MAMVKDQLFGKTMRKSYAKYQEILEMPNLLKIQKDSYQWFLNEGLQEVFRDVGTITDFSGKLELSFLDFTMKDAPKYTVEECVEGLRAKIRSMNDAMGIPNTLKDFGILEDEFKEKVAHIAELAVGDACTGSNPREIDPATMEKLLTCTYYGTEVDF